MARPTKAHKASEERSPKTLYLRRSVIRRALRVARQQERSLSQYVDRALARALEVDESQNAPSSVASAA